MGLLMKFLCSALLLTKTQTFVLFLSINSTIVFADHIHQHSNAPTFSDPNVLNPVSQKWLNETIKYDASNSKADLVVALGQQSYPIFKDLIKDYAKKNNLNIVVKPGTCGITAARLRKKSVDIGAYCCPPAKSDRLPGLKFHSMGISPIALIVHPENPTTSVSSEQARNIFKGQITRWTQVTNNKKETLTQLIKPIARLHCKIRPGHWRGLLKDEDQFSPRLFEVGVIPDMISQVSQNKGSIGWEVPLMVSYHKKRGDVKMLKIDNHPVTDLNHVLTGKYPLYRSYSLTTWREKTNVHAIKLIRFMQNYIEKNQKAIHYISPSQLKKAGWKFQDEELIGAPSLQNKISNK